MPINDELKKPAKPNSSTMLLMTLGAIFLNFYFALFLGLTRSSDYDGEERFIIIIMFILAVVSIGLVGQLGALMSLKGERLHDYASQLEKKK